MKQVRLGVALSLLAAALLVLPARAATATADVYGLWVNQADTASDYALRPTPDLQKLHVFWSGTLTHSGLRGSFDGTINAAGDAYKGTFHVTEGSVVVDGTGTFLLSKIKQGGLPLIRVHLVSSTGTVTDFTLEIWMQQPHAGPGGKVTFEEYCPGGCNGQTAADYGGTAGSPDIAGAAKVTVVGSTKFKIKAGHATKIAIHLNKAGNKLLKKLGSFKVTIVVTLRKSGGLPKVTKLGTVTLHK
jgi:hypothetical protein